MTYWVEFNPEARGYASNMVEARKLAIATLSNSKDGTKMAIYTTPTSKKPVAYVCKVSKGRYNFIKYDARVGVGVFAVKENGKLVR